MINGYLRSRDLFDMKFYFTESFTRNIYMHVQIERKEVYREYPITVGHSVMLQMPQNTTLCYDLN